MQGDRVTIKRVTVLSTALLCAAFLGANHDARADVSSAAYDSTCAMCHQKGGVGLKGAFPKLAGRAAEIAATAEGRRYLIEVTLFGLMGKIDVDGEQFSGVMPPVTGLSDADVAAALNYVISLQPGKNSTGNGSSPITAEEVAKVRSGPALTPNDVHRKRAEVLAQRDKKKK